MFSFSSCVNVRSRRALLYRSHKPMLAQLNGRQKVAPAVGEVLHPAALPVLRGKLAPLSFFLNTGVSTSCNIRCWFGWVKECVGPVQSISLAGAGVRAALLLLRAMPHLRDWEFFTICHSVQPAELSRSPASPVIPVNVTDEGCCMEVMLQPGLLPQSPLWSHWELSRGIWMQHFPEVLWGKGSWIVWGQLQKACLVETELKNNTLLMPGEESAP